MKKAESFLLGLLTAIMFLTLSVACSSDPGSEPPSNPSPSPSPTPSADYAPENVVGKEFRFYNYSKDDYVFKAIAAEKDSDAKISTGTSSNVLISVPCFFYEKTGKNEGYVYCSFYYQLLGIVGYEQIFDYELELTFLSENYGTYEGVLTHFTSADDSQSVSGVFVYDSDKTPAELAAELEDNDNKSKIDWRYLTASTWLYESQGYDIYMAFDDNGKFKQSLIYKSGNGDPITLDGKYTIDKSTNEINLSSLGKYKVEQLTQNTLKLTAALPDGSYPSEYALTYRATDSEMPDTPETPQSPEFAISEPIIENITETSATVKGTIIGEGVTFQQRGVCYSTEENPTVSDKVIQSDANVINSKLSELYAGTTYYVRLFAKVNDKITYGKQLSFSTTGRAATKIEFTPYKVSRLIKEGGWFGGEIKISAKLPNDIGRYGICYGLKPNPKITDNSLSEEYRKTEWTIGNIGSGPEYYIRAYHIKGSEVIYYEDSEICVETIGKNIKFSGSCSNNKIEFSWQGLEDGTYKVDVKALRYDSGDVVDTEYDKFYIEGGTDGEKTINIGGFFNHLYFTISPMSAASTIMYYYETYRSFNTYEWLN